MKRIAIVGAGIAGLSAALTLQDAGVACDLYESSNRVGGRIHSDTSWGGGLVSEWCGEFIDPDHATMLELIQRFGLATITLQPKSSDALTSVLYFAQRYLPADALDHDFEQLAPILHQQWQAVGYPTTWDHFTAEGYRLDHMSAHAWIEQYVAGGHTVPLGRLLDSACSGLYGLDSREQSALNLLYLYGSRDPSPGLKMLQPLQGRKKIEGGNLQLPLALARALPQGCIHLGHRLIAIERLERGLVRLSFATVDGSQEAECDQVILALPFSTLRQVDYRRAGFDARKQQAIEQLGYGSISKLFLAFDQPYWQTGGPWPHPNAGFIITDTAIQTLWDASLGQPGQQRILVDYTSGSRGAAFAPARPYATSEDDPAVEHYARACLDTLEQVFPGIGAHYRGKAALSYPLGDPNLLGSYACWRVGQYTLFGGYERVPQGPIHFAGEHCSVEYQGYMEGAAREGIRAAYELLSSLH